ncbi:MAG: hypothetical protein KIG97_09515 [Fibrobacter sp.]|uniref:hypothetical protein n=1 Tax=Fibrobacter sp. TaxID=35828 RepID=UPI0025C66A5C|nr:hypothetical protein [Fibrobacter sp.]MBS7272585.1 hypothetical protein [Fibrobacter sp.]
MEKERLFVESIMSLDLPRNQEQTIIQLFDTCYDTNGLFEMACLRKNKTGLPVNIYVDDSGAWKESGHANRIKFQKDKGDRPVTRDMIPMSIEDEPKVMVSNPDMELSASDINAVKKFVIDNKDLLEKLGNTEIDIEDFINAMIRQ